MFRTVGPSGSLFELLLPPGMRVLSGELAQIDELLDVEIPLDRGGILKAEMPCQKYAEGSTRTSVRELFGSLKNPGNRSLS